MALPLQKTKLFTPPARPRLVARPRLLERLDGLRADGCRVALVSAPAGSGKTTLIVQWLARQGLPAGWLSLDERDNLPARFFTYLVAALQAAVSGAGSAPRIGREALSLLDLPTAHPEEIITLLANDLVDLPGPFALVLDDFHIITNPLLHQAVDLLIEAQPPQMRLVLLTREDPGLHLARRRARGQLVELRQADLRFTLAETVDFLNQTMGLQLAAAQVEALEARTEGWIAGLQMAALALQAVQNAGEPRADDVERFLRDFSGSQRFILDYLVEEVLARQPAAVQRFLLDTAVLERMRAELCAAVTGGDGMEAQRVLGQLQKANLFVVPLDEDAAGGAGAGWFRYHHLFHDLLRSRLRLESPARAAALERRASDWYEANGEPRLAVEYALKAGDLRRAAELMDHHIPERWQTVDLDFQLLVNRLPDAVLAEWPALCLQRAWMSVVRGKTDEILHFVEIAEQALSTQSAPDASAIGPASPGGLGPASPEALGLAKGATLGLAKRKALGLAKRKALGAFARVLRAYVADIHNQPVAADEPLRQALAAIPVENVGLRNSVAVVIGTIYFMEGDFSTASDCFEEALAADMRVSGTNAVPIATARLALVLHAQGRLHEEAHRLRESEQYVRQRGSRRFYVSGLLNLHLGEVLLEWNRLEEAEAQVREGLRLLEDWPAPQGGCRGWSLLARVLAARGDLPAARAAIVQAAALKPQQAHPIFADPLEQARVCLWIAGQQVAAQAARALEDWARENEPLALAHASAETIPFRFEARLVELCRAWLALGRAEPAAELLERLAQSAQGRDGSRVIILALLAAARQPLAAALAVLDEAMRLAEPEGYLRAFVDAGPGLRPVLDAWLRRGPAGAGLPLYQYARQVRAALDAPAPGGQPPDRQAVDHALVESLSPRELEVLRLVAQGLTNQQIAARLVLSVRTVKKHIENIHGKLGVRNRTQAVARAREIGLLA